MNDSYFVVAKVSSAFGLEGGLKIHLVTDFPDRFIKGSTFYLDINGFHRAVVVSSFKMSSATHGILFVDGVTVRSDAEKLTGYNLLIPESESRSMVNQLDKESFLYCDLLKCDVYRDTILFGKVSSVVEGGGGEILIIKSGDKEYLLPFVSEMVDSSKIAEGRIDIYPAEGLFD